MAKFGKKTAVIPARKAGRGLYVAGAVAALGVTSAVGTLGAALVGARRYRVRRVSAAILPPGSPNLRVLHLSDLHLQAKNRKEREFLRALKELEPDFVVSTGDLLGGVDGWSALAADLADLLQIPGAFVFGSNDLWAPKPKSWASYLFGPSSPGRDRAEEKPDLPYLDMARTFERSGWVNLNNRTSRVKAKNGQVIELVGVDDPHLDRDILPSPRATGAASGAMVKFGLAHAPYQRVLNSLADAGCLVTFAGHTHGGQICFPGGSALVTNCDLPPAYASGWFNWLSPAGNCTAVSVSAGLGTSPFAPVRLFCPPEVVMLELSAAEK